MDRKKVENRLVDWSRQFGFVLPNGSLPQPDLFSQLVATPNRAYLWDIILNKLKSKEKVRKIRNLILAAELKGNKENKNKGYLLNVNSHCIKKKIDLWRKMEVLQKKISEKRKEIADLNDVIYKRAQSIQSEICKIAEIEKYNDELKEKVIISNLLSIKHRNALERYGKEIENVKSFGIFNSSESNIYVKDIKDKLKHIQNMVIEDLGKDDFELESEGRIYSEISLLITDKNAENKIIDVLIENKKDNLNKYSIMDSIFTDKHMEECDGKESDEVSVKLITEQIMLDITENSLHICFNKTCEYSELARLNEVLAKIKKIILNGNIIDGSLKELSYIKPNETGDSFGASDEKMSKLMKALSIYGLKKRRECLIREYDKLVKENEKNEIWTSEMHKFEKETLLSSEKLEYLKKELVRMTCMQKESAEAVLKKHNELASVINDINYRFKEKNIFERLVNLNKEIKKGMETTIELVENLFVDGFRKIQLSPGKEVFEFESLHHCLKHYGGELRELFCSTLLSPYDKPECILAKIEARKSFVSYMNEILKRERDREISKPYNAATDDLNEELLEKNYKEVERMLSKILMRRDFLIKEKDLVKQILRSWLEQPYRYMIPDNVKLNSMTLRQYESKYKAPIEGTKYCSDTNATYALQECTYQRKISMKMEITKGNTERYMRKSTLGDY